MASPDEDQRLLSVEHGANLARDTASVTFEVSDVSAAVVIPESQFRCLVAFVRLEPNLLMTLSILQSLPEMTDLVKPLIVIEVFCSGDLMYL